MSFPSACLQAYKRVFLHKTTGNVGRKMHKTTGNVGRKMHKTTGNPGEVLSGKLFI